MSDDSSLERTQVQFERWQYDALKARASREGRSLSGVVREAVTAFLAAPTASPTIGSIAGLASDAALRGEDHDALLYRVVRPAGKRTATTAATAPRPATRAGGRKVASPSASGTRTRPKAR